MDKKYLAAPGPMPRDGSCRNEMMFATMRPIVTMGNRLVGFASEMGMRLSIRRV